MHGGTDSGNRHLRHAAEVDVFALHDPAALEDDTQVEDAVAVARQGDLTRVVRRQLVAEPVGRRAAAAPVCRQLCRPALAEAS